MDGLCEIILAYTPLLLSSGKIFSRTQFWSNFIVILISTKTVLFSNNKSQLMKIAILTLQITLSSLSLWIRYSCQELKGKINNQINRSLSGKTFLIKISSKISSNIRWKKASISFQQTGCVKTNKITVLLLGTSWLFKPGLHG